MSRIQSETTKINDYYSTMPDPIPEESALDPAAARSTKDHPLSQQMGNILQDFTVAINELDVNKRSAQFQSSIKQVERFQAKVRQSAAQPGMDMGSIMLEVNQLLSKMRDAQRDHAIQQQQNALKMQETAYQHTQESIDSNKNASMIKGISGAIGGGFGLVGLAKYAVPNFKERAWKSAANSAAVAGEAGPVPSRRERAWKAVADGAAIAGEVGPVLSPLGTPIGELASMNPSAEAQQLNHQSDREKEYQRLNETQSDRKEADARDSSQQMRSIQQQMVDLYGKIISAVRW